MEIIIEEISRGHKLLHRHKFSQSSIRIGRDYQNDIILSDPHVCPSHITLEFKDEQWLICDHNSVNGSFIDAGKKAADQHALTSGDIITLGKSQVRVVFLDQSVPESVPLNPYENLIDFTRNPLALITSVLLFACVTAYYFYLSTPMDVTFSQLLVPTIKMTLMFSLWPLLVAVISHLTKHDARIVSQLGVCFLFYNLMWIGDVFEGVIGFNLSSNWPITVLANIIPVVLAFCLFWFNCSIGFHMSEKRRLTAAASLTILLFGSIFLITLSNKLEFSVRPQYNSTLMTPDYLMRSGSDVSTFIDDSQALFNTAQQAIKDEKIDK